MAKKKTADYETYVATSARARRVVGAGAAAVASAYKIEVRFLGGLNTAQKNAFKAAADRWASVIVGDLPSVRVDGRVRRAVISAWTDTYSGIPHGPTRRRLQQRCDEVISILDDRNAPFVEMRFEAP